jgi:hypothetical protein
MNTLQSSGEDDAELLALGTLQITNVGHRMLSVEVEAVKIDFLNGNDLTLYPSQANGGATHYILNTTDEVIEMLVSYRIPKDGDRRMFKYELLESQWEQKRQVTGENMLNVHIPGMLVCDLWKTITIRLVTCNIHNELYRQDIRLDNTDNVITTSSRLLERVKE